MTRDELHDMIDWLDAQTNNAAARTADFLRQIADAQPEHWAVELRWADRSKGGDWKRYSVHSTAGAAHSAATRSSGLGDIEARAVPLYRLPLEETK